MFTERGYGYGKDMQKVMDRGHIFRSNAFCSRLCVSGDDRRCAGGNDRAPVTVGGQTYYYKNGKKVKGWLTLKGKKYYPEQKVPVVLYKGWMQKRKRSFTLL